MYLVKCGSLYLTTDGTLRDSQKDAARFDTKEAARDARVALHLRPVKLTKRNADIV